ncbi:MAG: VWA domain-containing protein [Chloroflexi bacterium]|nr:VWA domain-containing protein [Chloroflexota bacterium]
MSISPEAVPFSFGELLVDRESASPLPLEQTEVNGQVLGMLATVALVQHFANPFGEPIELLYRFAIPHEASLAELTIRVGPRSIEGEIVPREEALQLYREAVDDGLRAAMATEERPNLYTVRIGNLQPGERVVARYAYSLPLHFDGGEFELTLPFGITPRYHRADEPPDQAAATDVAIAPPGSAIGALKVTIAIEAGVPITTPVSASHRIEVVRLDERRCMVRLAEPAIPNQDFVLRYRVSQPAQLRSKGWLTPMKDDLILSALFVPPTVDQPAAQILSREYVFILDRSGSMRGEPIAQARNALRACLRTLASGDTFRILLFDHVTEWYEPSLHRPLPFSDATVREADAFLDRIEGRGGTELLPALHQAMTLPRDPERPRVFVVLTDGAISAEAQVLELVRSLPTGDRLFGFGIGPSVNRYLLDRLARYGRGVAEVVGLHEDIEAAIIRFQDRLSMPVVTDLELEVRGAALVELYPSPLPDLFTGQVLQIVARLQGVDAAGPALLLRGRRGSEEVVVPIENLTTVDEPMLRRLWAQKRIDLLLQEGSTERDNQAIVELSRRYRILTPLTALLAVDQDGEKASGHSRKIVVSSPLPAGLDGAGGYYYLARRYSPGPRLFRRHAFSANAVHCADELSDLLTSTPDQRLSRPAGRSVGRRAESGMPAAPAAPRAPACKPGKGGIEVILRDLIRSQAASGAWGEDGARVELTAAAVVAFARAGQTPIRGSFRRPLRRALEWLERNATDPADQLYLVWVRAEVAAAQDQRDQLGQLQAEAAQLASLVATPVATAIVTCISRLAGLGTTTPAEPASVADHRVEAILQLTPSGLASSGLPMPWYACWLASGQRSGGELNPD